MGGQGGIAGWAAGRGVLPSIPNVAGRWLCLLFACCWARWGALWGRKFYFWEGLIYCIPIWDVFEHQREQVWALEQTHMHSRSLAIPTRQPARLGKWCPLPV